LHLALKTYILCFAKGANDVVDAFKHNRPFSIVTLFVLAWVILVASLMGDGLIPSYEHQCYWQNTGCTFSGPDANGNTVSLCHPVNDDVEKLRSNDTLGRQSWMLSIYFLPALLYALALFGWALYLLIVGSVDKLVTANYLVAWLCVTATLLMFLLKIGKDWGSTLPWAATFSPTVFICTLAMGSMIYYAIAEVMNPSPQYKA